MRTTRARLYSNFDNALVQHYSRRRRQQNGTRPDDDSHRCHHRRNGPVVTLQSVGVGWLFAFRSPQSTRNTRHAFSFVPRRRITLFLTRTHTPSPSLSFSYTLSPLYNAYSHVFFAVVHSWNPAVRVFPFC